MCTVNISRLLLTLVLLLCGTQPLFAFVAPGPVAKRKIDESKITYFVSVDGDDRRDGKSRKTAFATLQKAADVVEAGQSVLVTRGEYRQGVHIRKEGRADAWIRFIAEPGAVIRGSDIRKDWKREAGDLPLYSIPTPPLADAWHNPDTSLINRLEQVFVNGALLRQVPERAMLKPKGVFFVDDSEKKLYAYLEGGKNPNELKTEVSMRTYAVAIGGPPNRNFWRDEQVGLNNKAAYIVLDGFTVRHIGNFSRMAAIQILGLCRNIIIQNCDVQYANFCGIGAGSMSIWDGESKKWIDHKSSHITIRNCIASNNGVQGIGGGGVSDLLVENNIIDNNNYKGMSPWAEGGGVKTGFGGERVVLRNNVLRNNDNEGLWIDYGSTDCVIENNFIYNSLAGGILDEVTPAPAIVRSNGEEKHPSPTSAQVRSLRIKGTLIRNNIVIGTRAPLGYGISVSNSVSTEVTNNILSGNTGAGVQFGGSPNRGDTLGLWNNRAHSNLFDDNFRHAETAKDSEDPQGRYFNNNFSSNLFMRARTTPPLRISGTEVTPEVWRAHNSGTPDLFSTKSIFRDPERFDFTITDVALARKVGFNPQALRLDWREFYIAPAQQTRRLQARTYMPIALSKIFNRALTDETAGDGKGGWTDQGNNDMSGLPIGLQSLDNVPYQLGTKRNGAILLDNSFIKPGGFPKSVTVPISGQSFDEINFLYASAWTSGEQTINGQSVKLAVPEVARFIVRYTDGTQADVPIVVGRHVLDWWNDPTWREMATLNDNNTYAAWQGPNRSVGRVTTFYLRWPNPMPQKQISAVTISNEQANAKSAFFVLGMTGARKKSNQDDPRVLRLGFDGDVDAQGANGTEVEAQGFAKMAFDAGKFDEGALGKSYIPRAPIHYRVPDDWPVGGQGTISLWLKAENWTTPERMTQNKNLDYTRVMTPFSVDGTDSKYSPWGISFEVSKENLRDIGLRVQLGGPEEKLDATPWLKPEQWFHLSVTWQPDAAQPTSVQRRTYLNGKLLSERKFSEQTNAVGRRIYIGVPDNGGQPWRGAMDELSVWNVALPPERIAALAQR